VGNLTRDGGGSIKDLFKRESEGRKKSEEEERFCSILATYFPRELGLCSASWAEKK
jgi:hypothetical protein